MIVVAASSGTVERHHLIRTQLVGGGMRLVQQLAAGGVRLRVVTRRGR